MKRLTSIFLLILFSFLSRSGMGQVANDRTFPEIRSFHIELQYSDGTKDTMALKPDAKKNLFADLNTEIKVKMHPGKLGREYGITLTGKQAKPLKYVDVNFIFANDFKGADLLYFQNSVVTNAWANVQKPSENDENSRELVLFKNTRTSRSLNIAFSSFNRFYTLFKTNKNHVLLRYFMEDKPLEPGKSYRLETFVVDNQQAGSVFYEQYAAWLGKRNPVKSKPVPGGWSSWSVYYGNIRQQQILNDAKFIADRYRKYNLNTIQIDDGWHGKSWGDWKAKEGNFSWGMKALADSMNRYGLTMVLWYAPTMFKPESDLFTNHPEYTIFYDGKIIKSFGGGEKFGIAEHNAFYSL
ncbi:MAG: alpha-galactosidase, partial [Bacteroidota bacterium]|nr:alpha-galactosidase [Bacteroidota bacterium]